MCMLWHSDHIGLVKNKQTFTLDSKGANEDGKLWVIVANCLQRSAILPIHLLVLPEPAEWKHHPFNNGSW